MTMLTFEDLSVRRGGREVLAPVRASLEGDGMIGVIGPNGAGKSTLLQAMAGLLPHRGRWHSSVGRLTRRDIAFLPQNFAVRSALTVEECVLLGKREELGWRVGAADRKAVRQVLDQVGIAHLAQSRMDTLSGGQQQLVLIAQRLSRAPKMLILDEPTSALDLHHQIETLTLLRDHAADTGTLILIALHDLTLAARFCRSLILLADGHVQSAGPADQVLSVPGIQHCYRVSPELLTSRSGHPVVVPHRLG